MVKNEGVEAWPQVLGQLVELLKSNIIEYQAGSMSALMKICQDSCEKLDKDYNNERPLNQLVPIFIKFLEHPQNDIRRDSLSAVIALLEMEHLPNAITACMMHLLQAIFKLANDKDPRIRKRVCKAFGLLLRMPGYLKPNIENIFNFILFCCRDPDQNVAIEASEFWAILADVDPKYEFSERLRVFLPT